MLVTPNQAEAIGAAVTESLVEGGREGLEPDRGVVIVTMRDDGEALVRSYWREPDDPGHVSVALAVIVDRTGTLQWLPARFGDAA